LIERVAALKERAVQLRSALFEAAEEANLLVNELGKVSAKLINEAQFRDGLERRTLYAQNLEAAGRIPNGKLF